MKRCFLIVLALFAWTSNPAGAQSLSADEIIKKVDANALGDNKLVVSRMTIHGRRGSRTIEAKSWQRGDDESFTEYLAPAREKGTKMLKLDDQLWTYSPSTDRTILISGHMLRQSVMGSDLSYEDTMEDPVLSNIYTAAIGGEEIFNERPCWVIDLTAKVTDIAYHSRKIWVDKERFLTMKENRYARSGKLLKTAEIREVIQVQGRWIARSAVFKDVLKQGDGTELEIVSIEFNAEIPDHVFSKASLRR